MTENENSGADPRDGLINFAEYADGQLEEIKHTIDRARFPANFNRLLAELEKRANDRAAPPVADPLYGRFTEKDGLQGWLEAKINRSPVYGTGFIEIKDGEIVVTAWQRTWLGAPLQTTLAFSLDRLRNVGQEAERLRFEITSDFWRARQIAFSAQSQDAAQNLVALLPKAVSRGFEKHWHEIQDFNARLRKVTQLPLVTPIIIALNVLAYAAMCLASKRVEGFTPQTLMDWGANFGPLTVNGQWWRLLSALFVHMNPAHLIVNMWALWNVGRLCERIFGRSTLVFLYLISGLLASLTSIAWNPAVSSVGASGAIFGIFGAFLAFFLRPGNRVPRTIARRHWISTSAFVLFNIINGASQIAIDNAAHVGGLLAGLSLGFILARPLELDGRKPFGVPQYVSALLFIVIATLAAIWQVKGTGSELTASEQYFQAHATYVRGEAVNLRLWNELATKAAAGSISDAEFALRFENDIVPFWQSTQEQLEKENQTLKGSQRPYGLLAADYAKLRSQWAQKIIDAVKGKDQTLANEAKDLMNKTNLVQARLERVGIRSQMDHRPRALASNPVVARIRQFLIGHHWKCINGPAYLEATPEATDDPQDGPAARHTAGCIAQQLFMSADFQRLDSLMNEHASKLANLPDGSSSYQGIVHGLSDLFTYGGLSTVELLGRTSDWRRSVKDSYRPDVMEAHIFEDFAWAARGHATADSVTAQAWALFFYRAEMAAASLTEAAEHAKDDPDWYVLSLNVGLDQGVDVLKLRAIYDEGAQRFPSYGPLDSRMLRILMPRWRGSYEEVDEFINGVYGKSAASQGFERYTQLYSQYSSLEGDDVDLFADTKAFWSGMKTGFEGLVKRHPASDYTINRFANIACRANDAEQYRALRKIVNQRFSSVAWTEKYSLDSCDRIFAAVPANVTLTQDIPSPEMPLQGIGGIRLGMNSHELFAAKGPPIAQTKDRWVYNSVDARHNGVLTAIFSAEEKVIAIEYVGDQDSSPAEIPFLKGVSEAEIAEKFGGPVGRAFGSEGGDLIRYRNGIYVQLRNGRVREYGIYVAGH
jgi:membrane associated rhomboid family serine protease